MKRLAFYRFSLFIILFFILAPFLVSAQIGKGIITTLYQDITTDKLPPLKDSFGDGEIPTIYIYGYGGETFYLRFFNTQTGKTITTDHWYIPVGKVMYPSYPNLTSGIYKVELFIRDTMAESRVFSVQNSNGNNLEQINVSMPRGLLVFKDYIDRNKDSIISDDEFIGLEQRIFDLKIETICAYFRSPFGDSKQEVIFQSKTNDGKLIGETKRLLDGMYFVIYSTGPNVDPSAGDFMDKLGEAGPGKYQILAIFMGVTYLADIIIK